MTRNEHYEEAELLLTSAGEAELGSDRERFMLAAALVHATLASVSRDASEPAE